MEPACTCCPTAAKARTDITIGELEGEMQDFCMVQFSGKNGLWSKKEATEKEVYSSPDFMLYTFYSFW